MKTNSFSFFFMICALLFSALPGCQSPEAVESPSSSQLVPIASLANPGLLLYPMGELDFKSGQKNVISFQLINGGNGIVSIEEWHMRENENISFFYCDYSTALQTGNPVYQHFTPKFKKPLSFVPLDLQPGNSVTIECALPELPEGKYMMYAMLNSKIYVTTDKFIVTID